VGECAAGASEGASTHDRALFDILQRQQDLGLLKSAGTEELMRSIRGRGAGRGGRGGGRGGSRGRGRQGWQGRGADDLAPSTAGTALCGPAHGEETASHHVGLGSGAPANAAGSADAERSDSLPACNRHAQGTGSDMADAAVAQGGAAAAVELSANSDQPDCRDVGQQQVSLASRPGVVSAGLLVASDGTGTAGGGGVRSAPATAADGPSAIVAPAQQGLVHAAAALPSAGSSVRSRQAVHECMVVQPSDQAAMASVSIRCP
jgi:hypothetical protein